MGSLKRSSFPPVLKQYVPEYEPSFAVVPGPKQSAGLPKTAASCRCQTGGTEQQKSVVQAATGGTTGASRKSIKSPEPIVRETTTLQLKRQELKRYRQNYENWQAAKAELKEESGRQLRARILVQQELIRQQAELSALRQRELLLALSTRHEADKAVKQAKADALQQVCRQSLDDDKQKSLEERREKKKQLSSTASSKNGGSKDSLATASSSSMVGPSGAPRHPGAGAPAGPMLKATLRRMPHHNHHQSSTSSHSLLTQEALATQPSMVAEEAEEDLEEEEEARAALEQQHQQQDGEHGDEREGAEDEPLPWHWEQLYKMYGKQADYFLKPRPEEMERKKTVTILPNKLRVRGRAGAGSLWNSLRHDSQAKLVQQDMTISPELKHAYSAFVRQCLARRKKPVKRNYYAEEDVPEMDRLLDNSRVLATHDYKHMVEVMFRASVMNQDKTGVLMHNNPPPNLNNWAGNESCGRYMPSWLPDYDEEEEPPEYRKWLRAKTPSARPVPSTARPSSCTRSEGGDRGARKLSQSLDAASLHASDHVAPGGDNDQWAFLKKSKSSKSRPNKPKYMFLTEAAATCEGQFSKQRKELLESRHIPQAFNDKGAKPQSALAMAGDNSTRHPSEFSESPRGSATRAPSQQVFGQYTSNWQPLSMDALVEYKRAVSALGQGDFQHGTVPRWSVDMLEKAH